MPARTRPMAICSGLAVLVAGSIACANSSDPIACTEEARSALAVLVYHGFTDVGIAEGATLVLRDGTFADSVTSPLGFSGSAAGPLITPNTYERAGTYAVTVRRAGYSQWDTVGVRVTEDVCHVNTLTLTARLQPLE